MVVRHADQTAVLFFIRVVSRLQQRSPLPLPPAVARERACGRSGDSGRARRRAAHARRGWPHPRWCGGRTAAAGCSESAARAIAAASNPGGTSPGDNRGPSIPARLRWRRVVRAAHLRARRDCAPTCPRRREGARREGRPVHVDHRRAGRGHGPGHCGRRVLLCGAGPRASRKSSALRRSRTLHLSARAIRALTVGPRAERGSGRGPAARGEEGQEEVDEAGQDRRSACRRHRRRTAAKGITASRSARGCACSLRGAGPVVRHSSTARGARVGQGAGVSQRAGRRL